MSSSARKFCKWCPISFDIIANFFSVCCTAHLKAAPIVGSDPIRIGIESESNRIWVGHGPYSEFWREVMGRYYILCLGILIFNGVGAVLDSKYTKSRYPPLWTGRTGRYYIRSIPSFGMLTFEEREWGGTTYAIFPIFGDFLLRSYINSLMIFGNHLIFLSTESVLRKFAQTLKDLYYILMKSSHFLDIFIKM